MGPQEAAAVNATNATKKYSLTIHLPADLHRRWKVVAAWTGQTMEAIVLEALDGYVTAMLDELKKEEPPEEP